MKPRKSKICPTHAAEISGDSDHHRQYIGMHSREERRFWNLLMCHASVWISVVLWLVKIRSRKSGNLKGPARAWDFFKGGQWVDNLNTPVSTILCRTPIFFYIKHNSHLVTYDLDLRPPPIIPAPINQSQLLRTHQPTLPIPNPFRALLNVSRNHALGGGKSSSKAMLVTYMIWVTS